MIWAPMLPPPSNSPFLGRCVWVGGGGWVGGGVCACACVSVPMCVYLTYMYICSTVPLSFSWVGSNPRHSIFQGNVPIKYIPCVYTQFTYM